MTAEPEPTNHRRRTRTPKSDTNSYGVMRGFLVFVCHICILSSGSISADKGADNIEHTRTVLEKWVETRRIISQEKRDFELAREMLTERIQLVKREIKSLREKIDEAENSIAEADKKRSALVEQNEKLKEATTSLGGILVSLESRTKNLIRRLPDPIRERVKPLSQRLPEKPDETKLSIAQRFQNVIGILNEVDKFNRTISVASEVRRLDDGNSIEVTALYVGIGRGYYVNADETIAGTGTASGEGWMWESKNEAAPRIAEAIAILENEKPASFVQLPVEVH